MSQYQKGKTNLDFTESRDNEWQWHHLGHIRVCTLLQTDNHASTPPLSFLQARCPSCCPTNSIKALKADRDIYLHWVAGVLTVKVCVATVTYKIRLKISTTHGYSLYFKLSCWWDVGMVTVWSLVEIVCIWSCWCHCHPQTPSSPASFKCRLVLPFWYRLNQIVLEKRPLHGCSSNSSELGEVPQLPLLVRGSGS